MAESNELYATDGSGVLCSPAKSYCARLSPCSQEEADTRLLLDASDAVQKVCKKVAILTLDTDVVMFDDCFLFTFPIILFLEIVCNTINNNILEAKEVEQLPVKGMKIIRLKLSTDGWFKHFVSNL